MEPIPAPGEFARETRHRAENSLQLLASLLSAQLPQSRDRTLTDGLRSAIGRLIASAHLHDQWAGPMDRQIDIAAYLRAVCSDPQLAGATGPCRIGVGQTTGHALLDRPDALAVGLSVIEFVTSFSRHAYPGESRAISVTFGSPEGRLEPVVTGCAGGIPVARATACRTAADLSTRSGLLGVEIRIEFAGLKVPGMAELALAGTG